MMKTIWKYELEAVDCQVLEVPEGATILTVQVQHGKPCVWALVNPDAVKVRRAFWVHGTGHDCTDVADADAEYVGSVQLMQGMLVFHVFTEKAQ